jgi:predicted ArsR family transcriptional regulator
MLSSMSTSARRGIAALGVLDVPLARDDFLCTLLGHLTGAVEEVVGHGEAAGFVSVVGQRMGDELGAAYRRALQLERLDREQIAAVLVDLERRIQGDFFVVEQSEERIVFGNRACPFGRQVVGRPSLCMMTSNLFGTIAAENLGYARVVIEQSIARGDAGCSIVVHLKPASGEEVADGREYGRG